MSPSGGGGSRYGYPSRDPHGRRLQSIGGAFSIVETLHRQDPTSVTAIAEELGHPKSTVYSHLRAIEDRQSLSKEDGSYRLSLDLLEMTETVRSQIGNDDGSNRDVDSRAAGLARSVRSVLGNTKQ